MGGGRSGGGRDGGMGGVIDWAFPDSPRSHFSSIIFCRAR